MVCPTSWVDMPIGWNVMTALVGGQTETGSAADKAAKGTVALFSWACKVVVKKAFAAAAANE
jgi:hypothetical protein